MSYTPSFIEAQFPVSKISKESYKERKAGASQTLTGLGKWWGRKPLVLVRATIIGLLMPASGDPKKDLEIFLMIMTMDEDGLRRRRSKNMSSKQLFKYGNQEIFRDLLGQDVEDFDELKTLLDRDTRSRLNDILFDLLGYDEKLTFCDRPEQIDGPSEEAWTEINAHLGTSASSLQELVQELGEKQFGRIPRVGDAFCGGGSIPFEAARMGCEAHGSDLNPAAALLTWASLNIIGGGEEVKKRVHEAQEEAFDEADRQITEWGIEHNEKGWRADAYLYCVEAKSPATWYWVPLAPSWVISEKYKVCAVLNPNHENKRYNFEVVTGADKATMAKARKGTVQNSELICPETGDRFDISTIRGDNKVDGERVYGLRMWENEDLVPRPDDVFQERLYCIRYIEEIYVAKKKGELMDENGNFRCKVKKGDIITKDETLGLSNLEELLETGVMKEDTRRHFAAPDEKDLQREALVLELLKERFDKWQSSGYIPSKKIERGYNTEQPIRERGWSYWHHLFNPRQLLTHGLFLESFLGNSNQLEPEMYAAACLSVGAAVDNASRLCGWNPHKSKGPGTTRNVYFNQALNTQIIYGCRTIAGLSNFYIFDITAENKHVSNNIVLTSDARSIEKFSDYWITDPPYADAVNYHELGDFFVAWYEKHIEKAFSLWYSDSKSALAVKGEGESFKQSMVECYKNFTHHMPDNGAQVVMFTHQDSSVWADLALILWASGLQVTAAWTIQTETDSAGIKKGNYVQGTVIMVLRKRTGDEVGFLSDIQADVEYEVVKQLDYMTALDDEEDPNFGDADYQLAAYAAALRVLTQYNSIEDIDVEYELSKERKKGEPSEIEKIIESAVGVAMDHLVPIGFDSVQWRKLTPEERFYIKGLEIQGHGEYRTGVYQEMARGYGLKSYSEYLKSGRANETRLMTPIEFDRKELNREGFGNSLVRHVLFAIREAYKEDFPVAGRNWLKNELPDYWGQRKQIIHILDYMLLRCTEIPHWEKDIKAIRILRGYLENDTV
jgi:adenine-specific DNA methylase